MLVVIYWNIHPWWMVCQASTTVEHYTKVQPTNTSGQEVTVQIDQVRFQYVVMIAVNQYSTRWCFGPLGNSQVHPCGHHVGLSFSEFGRFWGKSTQTIPNATWHELCLSKNHHISEPGVFHRYFLGVPLFDMNNEALLYLFLIMKCLLHQVNVTLLHAKPGTLVVT